MFLTKVQVAFVVVLLGIKESHQQITECPEANMTEPCVCSTDEHLKSEMICNNVTGDQLTQVVHNSAGYSYKRFVILNTNDFSISHVPFSSMQVKNFDIRDCTVSRFELFKAFENSEKYLNELKLWNLDVQSWMLKNGTEFTYLRSFDMRNCFGHHDANDYKSLILNLPANLSKLYIVNCKLSSKEFSLERFVNLQYLSLRENRLTFGDRSYAPLPAKHLQVYDLSYNPMTSLKDNMFVGMPLLKTIRLQGTLLTILPQNAFTPVLDHLRVLEIWDTPLICNCNLTWILSKKRAWLHHGASCRYPDSPDYQELQSLGLQDTCPESDVCI